jgi:Domain of unknown function (DUF4124)
MTPAIIAAALLLAAAPAHAVNKCTGPDGRVSFQDAPCEGKGGAIDLKPASGHAASAPGDVGGATTETQRIEAGIEKSQRERRLRDLQEREVPRADRAIVSHASACRAEQEALERRKGRYVQNLYGKTDAAQAASEQAAAAARCDIKDRELRARAAGLRAECAALGGCP